MMQDIRPFYAVDENHAVTQNIAVGAAAASVNLTGLNRSVRLVNSGTQTVFVRFVTSAGGAATLANSFPLLPNTSETFFTSVEVTAVSAIASAVGSTLYITQGTSA